jgi:hypothetical protein
MEIYTINIATSTKPTELEIEKIQECFSEIPLGEIISGLSFIKNRWTAKDAGVLKVGRKSIINKEIHSITSEQAQWRLKNWKMMIANYRKLGYSYPTISRIKKHFVELSKKRTR